MHRFTAWKTPAGVRFLLAAPPWTGTTLREWEIFRKGWDWSGPVPVMSPGVAARYLEEAEGCHVQHGFCVLPGWRGLSIPDSCPGGVALDLQACFVASAYEGAR